MNVMEPIKCVTGYCCDSINNIVFKLYHANAIEFEFCLENSRHVNQKLDVSIRNGFSFLCYETEKVDNKKEMVLNLHKGHIVLCHLNGWNLCIKDVSPNDAFYNALSKTLLQKNHHIISLCIFHSTQLYIIPNSPFSMSPLQKTTEQQPSNQNAVHSCLAPFFMIRSRFFSVWFEKNSSCKASKPHLLIDNTMERRAWI